MSFARSIYAKIFLPLLIIFSGVVAYAYFIWLPTSVNTAIEQSRYQLDKTLQSVAEGLVPMLLEEQLSNIYDNLDLVKANNPNWMDLQLDNALGESLYPLEPELVPEQTTKIHLIKHSVISGSKLLGEILVVYDFSKLTAKIEEQNLKLFTLILFSLLIFMILTSLILFFAILKPLSKLTYASNTLAQGNYKTVLPAASEDEVGILVSSFSSMRDRIETAQQSMAEQNKQLSKAKENQVLLTQAYQRFVPPQLLTSLGKKSILDVQLGDQVEVHRSVLFSDIVSFTSIAEKMTPQETFSFVNSYLSRIGPIVRSHRGYIDKFIGDGVMALFTESATDAVAAAVGMQSEFKSYNLGAAQQGDQKIEVGIGIHTGSMMMGTLGEANRLEGSVFSDTVNLAARLESLTRLYGAKLLISEQTYEDIDKDQFFARLIDTVTVKGKKQPVKVYEIVDADVDEVRFAKQRDLEKFEKAIQFYQNQKFEEARKLFFSIVLNKTTDGVAKLYLERCEQLIKLGWDSKNWDGVTHLQSK